MQERSTSEMSGNVHKDLIRDDIIHQALEWTKRRKTTDLFCATLSASQYYFERKLHQALSRIGATATFQCAEGTKEEYVQACMNRPAFASILYGSLNELLFGRLTTDKYGIMWRMRNGSRLKDRPNQTYIGEIVPDDEALTPMNSKGVAIMSSFGRTTAAFPMNPPSTNAFEQCP